MKWLDDVYIFDTEFLTWTLVVPLGVTPGPRRGHAVVMVQHRLLVFGGQGPGETCGRNENFDPPPSQNTFDKVAPSLRKHYL